MKRKKLLKMLHLNLKKISLRSIAGLLFLVFVFFVPFSFSSIVYSPDLFSSGFLPPFLIQRVYFADIFFLLSFVFASMDLLFCGEKRVDLLRYLFYVVSFSLFLLLYQYFVALDFFNSLFVLLRLFQFVLVFLFLAFDYFDFKWFLRVFLLSALVQALIALLQFAFQSSLGLAFVGEPMLAVGSKITAKVSIFGVDYLRPYGTLPHPNILAAYLLIAMGALLKSDAFYKITSVFKFILLVILCIALLLTFSRAAICALLVSVLLGFRIILFKNWPRTFLAVSFLLIAFSVIGYSLFYSGRSGVVERLDLTVHAFKMLMAYPLGVGVGNFTFALGSIGGVKLLPWEFQPVHNLFLLALVELGLFFFLALGFLLYNSLKKLKWGSDGLNYFSLFLVLASFDHYFWTAYHGQFLLVIVFCLISKSQKTAISI